MMSGLPENHPAIHYYDCDYPGTETSPIAANLDSIIARQGLAHDIERFREIALAGGGPALEVGCGTGRVLIPLARAGVAITGVDLSAAMIERLKTHLAKEEKEVQKRVTLHVADICEFDADAGAFATIIIPFNGLSCLADQRDQQRALENAARMLKPGGRLIIDVVNPFALPAQGSPSPSLFFTRVNPDTGRTYSRFAGLGPIQTDQRQRLFGWYDEIDENGIVRREPYEMYWRVTFASELSLMADFAGLEVEWIKGDHLGSPYSTESPKIFMSVRKPAA